MRKIDIESWDRKIQYKNFITYEYPAFSICTRLDVTKLVEYCNKAERSFFSTFLYIVAKSVNEIDELKTRIVDDEVIIFDKITPSFVVLNDRKQIVTAQTPIYDDFEKFYKENREAIHKAKTNEVVEWNSKAMYDCIYVSCQSWIDLYAMNNPYKFSDKGQTSIPRITWGKCVEKDEKWELGFDVSLHHALADGYHVSLLIDAINDKINNFEERYYEG